MTEAKKKLKETEKVFNFDLSLKCHSNHGFNVFINIILKFMCN